MMGKKIKIRTWAPTIPFPPKKFLAYMCMEPPLPRTHPDCLPVSSARTPSTGTPIMYVNPWAR